MDTYINRILNITNSNCDEKTIKDDIQDDLDLIFELYHDRKDTRLRSVYLKYDIKNYLKLLNYEKKYKYLYMMKSYKNCVDVLRNILKNFSDTDEFDDIIKYILIKLFGTYYLERDIQLYNTDNVFKKYNMNMYNLLSKKYVLTKSKKLIFIKHKYDKKEYIINLLKKNKNFILKDNEIYKNIADEILKSDIDCYTKYVNDFCHNRVLNKKNAYHLLSSSMFKLGYR